MSDKKSNYCWLVDQLPTAKQKAPMWREFAEALQEVFDKEVKPAVRRLSGLRSIFTMDPIDVRRKINELGGFFYVSTAVAEEDLPLSFLQKLDEIHFKRTDLPIVNTVAREFQGLKASWQPLYAPKVITPVGSKDYTKKVGSNGQLINSMITQTDIDFLGLNPDDYFMTSRGVLEINNDDLDKIGLTQDQFTEKIRKFILPIIPLKNVFDGEIFRREVNITELQRLLEIDFEKVTQATSSQFAETIHTQISSETAQAVEISSFPEQGVLPMAFDAIPLDLLILDVELS